MVCSAALELSVPPFRAWYAQYEPRLSGRSVWRRRQKTKHLQVLGAQSKRDRRLSEALAWLGTKKISKKMFHCNGSGVQFKETEFWNGILGLDWLKGQ